MEHDDWHDLYITDREAFEQKRQEEIDATIESAPEHMRHRLRQLQWKLDVIHQTQPPLKATLIISDMMWDSFEEMRRRLNQLADASPPEEDPPRPPLRVIK